MPAYKAPLKDIDFVLNDVLDLQSGYRDLTCGEEATPDVVEAIANECAKFCENVLSPLNQSGDREGCRFEDGKVYTPSGFKEAYDQYIAGSWQGLSHPEEYGGQGMPLSLNMVKSELIGTANWSWSMYPGLTLGAMNTLYVWGTEAQKQTYLNKFCEGIWTGTMCLTESHCGSDLGQIKTRAVANDDGSYSVTGSKIFISSGEHDLADNIVHIVLARLSNAPEGIKGISLFIVPKYLPLEGDDAEAGGKESERGTGVGEFNHVHCGAIEEKLGIHGSSTCVINFDGARAFLLGPENKGVTCMFTFMNTARIGTAIQGLGAAELAYQGSLAYAMERASMRSLSGNKNPDKPADLILVHPDVRRMLLTQKAIAEGGRAMIYYSATLADRMLFAKTEEAREQAEEYLGFLTPILKAFLTEMGCEAANHGVQIFGGHGYIKEWGMEQILRDARISTLYEGTTGIQSLDLLARKVILDKGKLLRHFSKLILGFCKNHSWLSRNPHRRQMNQFIMPLAQYTLRWNWLSLRIALRASRNRDAVGAASVDYLMYSGYVVMAYFWAMMAQKAYEKLAAGEGDAAFYEAKIQTARFYFERMLPRAKGHGATMMASVDSVMAMTPEEFSAG